LHGRISKLYKKVNVRLLRFVLSNSVNGYLNYLQNQQEADLEGIIAEGVLSWSYNLFRASLAAFSPSVKKLEWSGKKILHVSGLPLWVSMSLL